MICASFVFMGSMRRIGEIGRIGTDGINRINRTNGKFLSSEALLFIPSSEAVLFILLKGAERVLKGTKGY